MASFLSQNPLLLNIIPLSQNYQVFKIIMSKFLMTILVIHLVQALTKIPQVILNLLHLPHFCNHLDMLTKFPLSRILYPRILIITQYFLPKRIFLYPNSEKLKPKMNGTKLFLLKKHLPNISLPYAK